MTRSWSKWIPAAVVPAVIVVGALTVPLQAGAVVDLPDKSPAEVLALVAESPVRALSGTIEQTSALGLPELPQDGPAGPSGAASVLDLLSGSHTARLYVGGAERIRSQVLDRLAERNLVRSGDEVWLYDSRDNTALHSSLSAGPGGAGPGGVPLTPAELAERMLAAIDPSTEVTVGADATVAGRSAYELVLTPRSTGTLVESVTIAVDSETGLVLGVVLRARGQAEPAFSLAFTALALEPPPASVFDFVPPAGATVEELALPVGPTGWDATDTDAAGMGGADAGAVVVGEGWDSVVQLPAGSAPSELPTDPLFDQLTTAVPGGRLFRTALVNALFTDDGRVFAGTVPAERLQFAAIGG